MTDLSEQATVSDQEGVDPASSSNRQAKVLAALKWSASKDYRKQPVTVPTETKPALGLEDGVVAVMDAPSGLEDSAVVVSSDEGSLLDPIGLVQVTDSAGAAAAAPAVSEALPVSDDVFFSLAQLCSEHEGGAVSQVVLTEELPDPAEWCGVAEDSPEVGFVFASDDQDGADGGAALAWAVPEIEADNQTPGEYHAEMAKLIEVLDETFADTGDSVIDVAYTDHEPSDQFGSIEVEMLSPDEIVAAPQDGEVPIGQITLDIRPRKVGDDTIAFELRDLAEKLPEDSAALRYGTYDQAELDLGYSRNEGYYEFAWAAPAFYHYPLYFEQPNLERYGHYFGGPCIQAALSSAHFFVSAPLLPYKIGAHPPRECDYTLGHYRPGNCSPHYWSRCRWSLPGLTLQGAATTGFAFLLF